MDTSLNTPGFIGLYWTITSDNPMVVQPLTSTWNSRDFDTYRLPDNVSLYIPKPGDELQWDQ